MAKVYGSFIDKDTRCKHYYSPSDIMAIKFKCCNKYYPCYKCHNEHKSHPIQRWAEDEFDEKAIMCQYEMSIYDYMMFERCPPCGAQFNSRCKFSLPFILRSIEKYADTFIIV